jgi:hypothetical protein
MAGDLPKPDQYRLCHASPMLECPLKARNDARNDIPGITFYYYISIGKSWRRERDSNPRYGYPYTDLANQRLQPLGHPSAVEWCCFTLYAELI